MLSSKATGLVRCRVIGGWCGETRCLGRPKRLLFRGVGWYIKHSKHFPFGVLVLVFLSGMVLDRLSGFCPEDWLLHVL